MAQEALDNLLARGTFRQRLINMFTELYGRTIASTESAPGIMEIATQPETNTGTDDLRAVTPLKLKTKVALRSAKTAAYAIVDDDDQTEIAFDLPSDDNITIDQMYTDYMIGVSNIGAGQLNFVAGTGVTLLGAVSLAGGVVSGAYIRFISATVAYVMSANNVTWGQISSRPTTVAGFVITDTISILNSQFTSVGNVGTGDDTLHTFTVPGGTLATNGQTVTAYAAGTFAATANNKRLRVKWGATTIFDSGALAVTAASSWVLEIRIMRTGAATQRCCVTLTSSDAAITINANYATATETLTSGSALSVTGEATSNNDIVEEIFKVRKEGV